MAEAASEELKNKHNSEYLTLVFQVNPATPAQAELVRGDVITKIDDYDARDLRHEDAQNLFKNAGNTIKLAIQRYIDVGLKIRFHKA